jgi:hypothetical protein
MVIRYGNAFFLKDLTEINDLETISLIFSTAHVVLFRA